MRKEWMVVVLTACGLLVAELALRGAQDTLSGDVAHLNDAESIVSELEGAPGLRVLLIGNSLLLRGIDPVRLESRLETDLGREVSLGMVHPDGTGPVEWSYLYRRLVFNPDRLPDVIVMAFGPGHLRDSEPSHVLLRLAAHHVDGQDLGLLFDRDLTDIESRSQFVVARVSTAFAIRDRIAPRVFDAIIPRYRELAPILLSARTQGARVAGRSSEPAFTKLEQLLDDAIAHSIPVIALPMPAPDAYEVDAGAARAFSDRGISTLPAWQEVHLSRERFPDLEHLDPEGQAIFTNLMAPELSARLREGGRN